MSATRFHKYDRKVRAAVTRRLAGERPTIWVTHDRTAAELLGWPIREI